MNSVRCVSHPASALLAALQMAISLPTLLFGVQQGPTGLCSPFSSRPTTAMSLTMDVGKPGPQWVWQ